MYVCMRRYAGHEKLGCETKGGVVKGGRRGQVFKTYTPANRPGYGIDMLNGSRPDEGLLLLSLLLLGEKEGRPPCTLR
eukprot:NODE_1653_length_915_cov_82.983834_g1162_i0.p3 GENE.NODE_1653_length_915_cov_82.983834_g1162_i0~~NODE_1653_length_915_cov_82.983834_g1162_i0.p3  ORF type:complete len:78 (-),score=10.13 NODE_1653_length_915_cov_82.983834_g1162_i0:7-240(-)